MQREIEGLVEQFETRTLTRRQLVAALAAMVAGGGAQSAGAAQPVAQVAQGRTINHVSLAVSDVQASAEFYPDPGRVHHFCIGVDDFDADRIKARFDETGRDARVNRNPDSRTSGGDQLYFNDPDGTVVQLGANGYQG